MGKASYVLKRIMKMDISAMKNAVKHVSKRSGKCEALVFLDMVWCGLRYQAGYADYNVFELERANAKQRKTFITRGVNNKFVKRFNDSEHCHFFSNKDEFNERFSEFLGRDWLKLSDKESFVKWVNGRDVIISKPRDGMCGKGIVKLKPADFANAEELFSFLKNNGCGLVEECLTQHEDMNKLYAGSINTIRVVTINKGGNVRIICTFVRIGNGGDVDNFNSGGMMTRVNFETGKIMFEAVDKSGKTFEEHPMTGVRIKDYQIPMWREVLELARKAAAVIPQVGYVGWDVAITPNGPVLVEGNEFPGHDIYQMPAHTKDNYGLLPLFEAVINS
ncbi:MAG: hypothetical protein GX824_07600 [Clostridiales bacterium]|jgi:glutathione synthase/RimK-type ligase-like ATP-grasp enzyme|nr:hypothetical protein [Clostridiales bacterium]